MSRLHGHGMNLLLSRAWHEPGALGTLEAELRNGRAEERRMMKGARPNDERGSPPEG